MASHADEDARIEALIATWSNLAGGAERKNFAPFIYDLIDALNLPRPEPGARAVLGNYEFEGTVAGGSAKMTGAGGSADLYKRGCFVMEAKQSYLPPEEHRAPELFDDAPVIPLAPSGARYDRLMIKAQGQAKNYAVNLPGDHPSVPFLIVCDIGRAFELFFDFAGNGRGYGFFPDKNAYRVPLVRLREPEVRALFKDIWTNPAARDPKLRVARVSRDISRRLAQVSAHIEDEKDFKQDFAARGDVATEEMALFLMRLLFCMFAEDIGLLPKDRFKAFLESCTRPPEESPSSLMDRAQLANGLQDLWHKMAAPPPTGRWTWALAAEVRHFNGGLFEQDRVYPLSRNDLDALIEAARHEWRDVEPAIFGTLLEQALSASERSKLGAHYTPRAYVERLVDATIMDVLNVEWDAVQEAITAPDTDADTARARAQDFHDRIAAVTVLDPACGTGNFLYVAMEAIERLEAQVVTVRQQLGDEARARVGPHQFFGLEKNPRAAKIAELVLWIGWLRFRIQNDPESIIDPVLARGANINFGYHGRYDAVLDEVTGLIPDWPEAEFIVGNPPFIGKGQKQRRALGSDYLAAMHQVNSDVPRSGNYFLQWWDRSAKALQAGTARRFGLVTSNTISQPLNRKVLQRYLEGSTQPISVIFAIPDHHWVRGEDSADVRIAMTVCEAGDRDGTLLRVVSEEGLDTDDPQIRYSEERGRITPKLTLDDGVHKCAALRSNSHISSNGVLLAGRGFIVSAAERDHLLTLQPTGRDVFRPYVAGSELMKRWKGRYAIDFSGMTESEARAASPTAYQHLMETVRVSRLAVIEEETADDAKKYAEQWWLFG